MFMLCRVARLAQLVERHMDVVDVVGSSPTPRTNEEQTNSAFVCSSAVRGASPAYTAAHFRLYLQRIFQRRENVS